jgi:hypothetical protein
MYERLADWLDAHDDTITFVGWALVLTFAIYIGGSVALR